MPRTTSPRAEALSARQSLPVFQCRRALLAALRDHQSVVLAGETGSGKTTQLPQLLLSCVDRIAVTQPRRVAAISLAKRVALEAGAPLGALVGYCVRFDEVTSGATRLRYVTDGMLLREAMVDGMLRKYDAVVLDEAHERSVATDILFGVVRRAQRERRGGRSPLKVVVMSATLDIERFLRFFDDAVAVHVEGREFPVKVMYAVEAQMDYLDSAVVAVLQICVKQRRKAGDILVFLTGQEEIEACAELLEEKARLLPEEARKLVVCPIFAALPAKEQLKVFAPTPQGCRKVILATNIAETSITVSGIRFVVDSGMVKAKQYNPKTGLQLLQVVPVSQAQAWQRSGRAGREAPGVCYRLYTEKSFSCLQERGVPEIRRVELSEVVLQIMALGYESVQEFGFLEKPSAEALRSAHVTLFALGAIDLSTKRLSALGRRMAALPLQPAHSKFLLESFKFGCTEEVVTISAMLNVESPLYTPRKARDKALQAHKRFSSEHGDHIMLLNIYKAYEESRFDRKWCAEQFLKVSTLTRARKIRAQLCSMLQRTTKKQDFPSCSPLVEPVLQCLVSAFALQVAKRVPRQGLSDDEEEEEGGVNAKKKRRRRRIEMLRKAEYKTVAEGVEVSIHPSSSLFGVVPRPEWVCYDELIHTSKNYLRGVSRVEEKWLVQVAPTLFQQRSINAKALSLSEAQLRKRRKQLRNSQHIMCDNRD